MHRTFLVLGFALGLVGVAAGAFGAHGLRDALGPQRLATFETAVRYQMYHALALIGVGIAAATWPNGGWSGPGTLFALGVLVFSGSLYALSLTEVRVFGAIAPLGGACLIAGWAWALLSAWRTAL